MFLYPDSYDLIDLSNGQAPISIPRLTELLAAGCHKVAFSFDTLIEVSAPLMTSSDPLEVRGALNRLEELPHVFVNEARIREMELREALAAFQEGREFDIDAIRPFAGRIDQAIDVRGYPQYVVQAIGALRVRVDTGMIVNLRIWDAIYEVWRVEPEAFNVYRRRERDWMALMEADRALERPPRFSDHFATVLAKDLATHGIPEPADIESFGRWVYKSPARCPGIRLAYEAHHRFRANVADRPQASDIIDLGRVAAIPYVDFFVTDGSMLDYCRQASRGLGDRYSGLFGRFSDALARL